jgi:hypothetical protein
MWLRGAFLSTEPVSSIFVFSIFQYFTMGQILLFANDRRILLIEYPGLS